MTQQRILVTGFNAFERFDNNPSERLVEYVMHRNFDTASRKLLAGVLPTEYRRSEAVMNELITSFQPTIILSFGLGFRNEAITIERKAVNIDGTTDDGECRSDNGGERRFGTAIIPGGPPTYNSTLPVSDISRCFVEHRIPHQISNDAGRFICNHIFYYTCHLAALSPRLFMNGFFHIPPLAEDTERWGLKCRGCTFDQITAAFDAMLCALPKA